jgi:hypothetical protein
LLATIYVSTRRTLVKYGGSLDREAVRRDSQPTIG